MAEMTVALQIYTVADGLKTRDSFVRTMAEVKKMGYQAVQVYPQEHTSLKEMKPILDNEGLVACATHTDADRIFKQTQAVAEDHRILGAKHVVCPGAPGEMRNSADGFKKLAQLLTRAGEILAKSGLTLSYHNHAFELAKFDGRTGLEILYSESDPKYVNAEIDTYWAAFAGADPAAWCRKSAGRMPTVHFKGLSFVEGKQIFAEVGEGNLNWDAIIPACREAGARWCIVEQDRCLRPTLESAALSLKNLHRMGLR